MGTVEEFILGNGALHDRFFATTEILARLVSSAPRSVSMAQLEDSTGRSVRELSKLCQGLARAGLLCQDPKASGKWLLACDASQVTLEDVFRCVLAEQQGRTKAAGKAAGDRASNDVALLLMQAMIAINQSVFKQLRQFSLDRLKISAAGMFPEPRRPSRPMYIDDAFNMATSSRDLSYDSAVQLTA
jgi:DNA-binding IscR family transcriptional regulator